MDARVFQNPEEVARVGAGFIAAAAREAIAARREFRLAVSGGQTPWMMLRHLAQEELYWPAIHVFQVDERDAPDGHPDRNLTHLRECLDALVAPENLHAMPVERTDRTVAANTYAELLAEPLDLIHLGLGPDGHTASLVPGDPVLDVVDADVAWTNPYQGRCRMTMTYPLLDRSRAILWVVTGSSKATMTPRLLAGDHSIPAGRVSQTRATLLVDAAGRGD